MLKSIFSGLAALSLSVSPALALPGQSSHGIESQVTQVQAKQETTKDGAKKRTKAAAPAKAPTAAPKNAAKAPAAAPARNPTGGEY